jgi:hypothetical protein
LKAEEYAKLFAPDVLDRVFPADRADQFFEALFGDASEGAYDIRLAFKKFQNNQLKFHFELIRRPGKCLACNLTYGLPQVFSRHPIVNVKSVISEIDALLPEHLNCNDWEMGETREISGDLHIVPLFVTLSDNNR